MIINEIIRYTSEHLLEIHQLLDICYPNPPKDVFYRFVALNNSGMRNYHAFATDGKIIGMVQLSPNSKGGTLETLAVHPNFRGQSIGNKLCSRLLLENQGVIQLTTRIPKFFGKLGFSGVKELPDKSMYMVRFNTDKNDYD